ncbi:MAG: diacylglycerol kinase family protein [Oscillospiraceae bacterium]|jgi:diacylglycerol kinase|nr:diacylglycerol kinase family protein [Oscillospiraceae bacterium]
MTLKLPPKRSAGLIKSFSFALAGLSSAYLRERNLRIHIAAGIIALYAGFLFGLSRHEWVLLILTVGLTVSCELMNAALEHLADLTCGENPHPLAKAAKDMAAGAVLICALCSFGAAFFLFGDIERLAAVLRGCLANPLPTLFILAVAACAVFFPAFSVSE